MIDRAQTTEPRPAAGVALVLVNNSGIGGTERRFAQVYRRLRQRGQPVSLAINASLHRRLVEAGLLAADAPDLLFREPVGRWWFGLRKLDYLLAAGQLAWWLLKRRPAALHLVLGGAYVALPAQWAGWAPPALLSIVCPSLAEMVGSPAGLALYRRAMRAAARIDVLTESVRDMARKEGVPAERLSLSAGSCVDVEKYRPAPSKQPWVVFAGRLIEEKNPLLFVQACAMVRREAPQARFFLLGDGPMRGLVEEARRRLGLAGCMEVGWREDLAGVLGEALIFASLQRMDNYPSQALLEAMASGTAVVATDVGLTAKLVPDAVGLRVPPDAAALARAMLALLRDAPKAEAMGRQARALVLREHSMDAYAQYLETQYAALVERAEGRPACAEAVKV